MPKLILTEKKIYKNITMSVCEHRVLHAKALSIYTFLLVTLCFL